MHRPQQPVSIDWPQAGQRPFRAWLLSMIVHCLMLIAIGLSTARERDDVAKSADPSDSPAGDISLALVHRHNDRSTATADAGGNPAASPAEVAVQNESVPPDFAPPIDLDGVLAELMATADPSGLGGVADSSAVAGIGGDRLDQTADGNSGRGSDRGLRAAGSGSPTTVSLFGVEGTASRFVYVVDRSESMNGFGGRPLVAAKSELIRSLNSLTQQQAFQLVLYNHRPTPFVGRGGSSQMMIAEAERIVEVSRYLEGARAFGETNHRDALRMAMRLGPEVIFFLTDGHLPPLSERELADLCRQAERGRVVIHAIEFGTRSEPDPGSFVKRLASECRGNYRYFDVRQFSLAGQWGVDDN